MPKKRRLESDEERSDRLQREGLVRIDDSMTEERALDAAVRQSIKLYGP